MILNLFVVSPVFNLLMYPIMKLCKISADLDSFPSFNQLVLEFIFFILVEEILFYYSHRLLHYKGIYGKIHKIHHEWTAPIAFVSIYAHPCKYFDFLQPLTIFSKDEHILSNLVPVIMGPLLLGSHLATIWCWISLALITTLNSHSGYHFPLFPSPEAHDYLGILDFLHG